MIEESRQRKTSSMHSSCNTYIMRSSLFYNQLQTTQSKLYWHFICKILKRLCLKMYCIEPKQGYFKTPSLLRRLDVYELFIIVFPNDNFFYMKFIMKVDVFGRVFRRTQIRLKYFRAYLRVCRRKGNVYNLRKEASA